MPGGRGLRRGGGGSGIGGRRVGALLDLGGRGQDSDGRLAEKGETEGEVRVRRGSQGLEKHRDGDAIVKVAGVELEAARGRADDGQRGSAGVMT